MEKENKNPENNNISNSEDFELDDFVDDFEEDADEKAEDEIEENETLEDKIEEDESLDDIEEDIFKDEENTENNQVDEDEPEEEFDLKKELEKQKAKFSEESKNTGISDEEIENEELENNSTKTTSGEPQEFTNFSGYKDFYSGTEENPENKISASEPTSATYTEKAPLKDFLALLLIIPVLPFYIIYLIIRGKNKRFITYFFGGLIMVSALVFLGYKQYAVIKAKEKKVIKNIDEYIGETEIDQKLFEQEYKNQVSTIASSIDTTKIPKQLEPMLFVRQDMLTINYYHYLISAGYMGNNAEGAIYILQTALYSKNKELADAAWKSLHLIGTPQAMGIIELFKKANPQLFDKNTGVKLNNKKYERNENTFGNDLKTEFDKIKYNLQNK
jgi:hypothetical protein